MSEFYKEMVSFAHIFSSDFVNPSWFLFSTFTNWDPNEVLWDGNRPIRDWRERSLAYHLDEFENEKLAF